MKFKFGSIEIPPKTEGLKADSNFVKTEQFTRVPLTDEEQLLSIKKLAEKYGLTPSGAFHMKERGYRRTENPNFISKKTQTKEKNEEIKNFFNEVTPLEIDSIETIFGNINNQEKIKDLLVIYNKYKTATNLIPSESVSTKKFKLLNGQEVSFGDLIFLDKILKNKIFRNNEGVLMFFSNKENKFIPFKQTEFWGNNDSFTFKEVISSKSDTSRNFSLEKFAPQIFKMGIFKEEDFGRRSVGTNQYEMYGPHERKLTPSNPYAFLSNEDVSAKYYIGREKFNGTDKKIDHNNVSVSLLDNKTGVVVDDSNGKKNILYTFPLINIEEYNKQKEEILRKRKEDGKSTDININDYITKKAELNEYKITDYVSKKLKESDMDYTNRIYKLSDTSYVLGNFRSFMSETGLAANNYSWREQLILSDALTEVGNKDKIVNLGRNFGKDGIRTFLSIEQGGKEMSDKILTLGEKLSESGASILFKTYGEMIDATDEVEDILKDNLKEKVTPEIISNAKESLLINGKNLLDKYGEKAKVCEGSVCEDIGKELEERLSLAKKSVFAFSAACKILAEKGEFSFEDFQKAKLSYDQSPLVEKMKEKIIKMHQENTKQYPDKLRDLWRGTLKDGLEKENPNQLVVSASYEDEVVSAMRVIKREDGSWYGASFNVNPTIQGGRIGSELLKEVLKDLAKDKPFVADCYSKNPMLETYLNKFGFKITKEVENYHDTGELVYEITLLPEEKKEI